MAMARTFKRVLCVSLAAVIAIVVVGYLLFSGIPASYNPSELNSSQRNRMADEFVGRILDFMSRAQDDGTFTWSLDQEEFNRYLASFDEIASFKAEVAHGDAARAFAEAGLADPAVALRSGVMTLMVRLKRYNVILSIDMSFSFARANRLEIRPRQVRLGRLRVPDSIAKRMIGKFEQLFGPSDDNARDISFSDRSIGGTVTILERIIASIGKAPLLTEFEGGLNGRPVRIEAVEATNGRLTLHVRPLPFGSIAGD